MAGGLIEIEWQSYKREVLPIDPSPTQVSETRRGFYAGAQSMLNLMSKVEVEDVSVDQGVEHLERLTRELEAFFLDVGEGRA